jgi:hypothetical protein
VLNFHEQKLTLGDFLETQKQSALEEAEEPKPEPQERTRTVVELTEGLRLIAVLIKMFEDIDSKGQRAAKTRLGIIRMLAGYEEILQKKKKYLSRRNSVLDFFKSISDTRTSPPALLGTEDDNP